MYLVLEIMHVIGFDKTDFLEFRDLVRAEIVGETSGLTFDNDLLIQLIINIKVLCNFHFLFAHFLVFV